MNLGLRRLQIGIMFVPVDGVGFRDKIKLVRELGKNWGQHQAFIAESVAAYAAATGTTIVLDADAAEFNWTEFYEFLKWLIPLLLELFAGLSVS